MSTLESVDYVETFHTLKLKYEQEMDRVNNRQVATPESSKYERLNIEVHSFIFVNILLFFQGNYSRFQYG